MTADIYLITNTRSVSIIRVLSEPTVLRCEIIMDSFFYNRIMRLIKVIPETRHASKFDTYDLIKSTSEPCNW